VTTYLDLDDLLAAAAAALARPPEIRDLGLLEAAAYRPQASAFGEDAYPTVHEKAGALMHSIARNHALVDGNKRLAWVAGRLFYRLNGWDMRAPSPALGEAFVLAIAAGATDVAEIAKTLTLWSARH